MDATSLKEIIGQYARHDWRLRRVLTVYDIKPEVLELIGDAEIELSVQNALWFSRRSLPDREAWELRRLDGSPFALVTVIPDDADDDEREAMLAEIEEQMAEPRPAPTAH